MTKSALCSALLLGCAASAAFAQAHPAAKTSAQSSTAAKPAAASTGARPTDAEVRKLFVAMGMKQQIDTSMKALFGRALDQQTRQAAANLPSMDDADRNFFMQVQQQELAKASDPAFIESIMSNSIAAYKTHLSAQDVLALTTFYNSPSGQHYQAALPEISKEEGQGVRTMVQSRGKQILEDQQTRLQAYIAKKQSAPAPAAPAATAPGASATPPSPSAAPADNPAATPGTTAPADNPASTPGTAAPADNPASTPGTAAPSTTPPPKL